MNKLLIISAFLVLGNVYFDFSFFNKSLFELEKKGVRGAITFNNKQGKHPLDAISKNITFPYGSKKVIEVNFPEHWYCGDGYLTTSLKEEGYEVLDSMRYA